MGTWSSKPFGNDSAMDWIWSLESTQDANKFILDSLDPSNTEDEQAVAAATLVAKAAFEKVSGLPKEAKEWIETTGYVPSYTVIERAIESLTRILDQSELKDSWEESGSLKSWVESMTRILDQLTVARNAPQIQRTPKKRGIPKSLHKLVDRYMSDPDPVIEARIMQKVQALPDPNEISKDTNWDPPLCLMAKAGLLEATKILLNMGADPNFPDGPNITGFTINTSPFTYACWHGHIEVAEVLLSRGAELFSEAIVDKNTGAALDSELHNNNPNAVLLRYYPALTTAVIKSNPGTIDFLLSKGCSIEERYHSGETLLHIACRHGNTQNAAHLIKLGIPIDRGKKGDDSPAIFEAVRANKYETTEFLIQAGANINALDTYYVEGKPWHDSSLDAALLSKDQKMVDILRLHGALTGDEIVALSNS